MRQYLKVFIFQACPFILDIYSETCTAKLTVSDLNKGGRALEQSVVDATMGKVW